MPHQPPLNSRNLSSGLAIRTLKNLHLVYVAHEQGSDVHIVTQAINSLLSLLMLPIERDEQFFSPFEAVPLGNPPDFAAVRQVLPKFPVLPSLQITLFGDCTNAKRFLKRIRNAISHRRLEFSSESHNLEEVVLRLRDAKPKKPVDWDISLNAQDLLNLAIYIAHEIIDQGI